MNAAPLCSETTAAGAPCKKYALPGSSKCDVHTRGPNGNGRPSKLTSDVADSFVAMLRAGNYIGVAASAVGISRRTFAEWMNRGLSARVEDAPFRDFRDRVEQARAEGEVRNVTQIATAARESWQAAAWLLERSYPERWGRPSAPQRQEAIPEDVVVEDVDPFAEVVELAQRRNSRAR
jgi:hypothetical protein